METPQIDDMHTEYKSRYSIHVLYTICAFLNTDGGIIYIGPCTPLEAEQINERLFGSVQQSELSTFLNNIQATYDDSRQSLAIHVAVSRDNFASIRQGDKEIFYLRKGSTNVVVSSRDIAYQRLVYTCKFPKIEPISLSLIGDDTFLETYRSNESNVDDFYLVGNFPTGKSLYKYMDLGAALLSLDTNTSLSHLNPNIRFIEPTGWEDEYEGRFYGAIYDGIKPDVRSPFLYACCFTTKRDNEAAWAVYSHGGTGISSVCVEFKLNKQKLVQQFLKYLGQYSFYMGRVEYKTDFFINSLHKQKISGNKSNPEYYKYFQHFSLDKYLNLLLLKRKTFEHESEVRIFAVPKQQTLSKTLLSNKKSAHFEFFEIDWADILEGVRISDKCSNVEYNLLQQKLNNLRPNSSIVVERYSPHKVANQNRSSLMIITV